MLKIKTKAKSKISVSVSQYNLKLFPNTLNFSPSFTRLLLAKKRSNGKLKHITGAFEMFEERCGIITEEDQEAGTYYAYIELDQLDNDEFSVLVMAQEIESID